MQCRIYQVDMRIMQPMLIRCTQLLIMMRVLLMMSMRSMVSMLIAARGLG